MSAREVDDMRGALSSVRDGLVCALGGARLTLDCGSVRQSINLALILVCCSVPIYIVTAILFGLLCGLVWLVDYFASQQLLPHLPSLSRAIFFSSTIVSALAVSFLRWAQWSRMDAIFLNTLAADSAAGLALSDSLRERIPKTEIFTWPAARQAGARFANNLGLFLVVLALSRLPYVGVFAFPVMQLRMTSRVVGARAAIAMSLVSLLPFLQPVCMGALALAYGANTLVKELLDPVLLRLDLRDGDRIKFLAKSRWLRIGFGLAFAPLTTVPLLGPPALLLAQASLARLVLAQPLRAEVGRALEQCHASYMNKLDY
jgi:hypothetical protein